MNKESNEHPIVQLGLNKGRVLDKNLAEAMAYVEKRGRKKVRFLEKKAVRIHEQTKKKNNRIKKLIKKHLLNTPMIDIALKDIDQDLKVRFPDIDADNLMKNLGNDLIRINGLFSVLEDEYGVGKKRVVKKNKDKKSEPIPEPMLRAFDDLSETAWDITLVNVEYILERIKGIDIIGWEYIDYPKRSDILSIGLIAAHRVVLNHNPFDGITRGKIFQQLTREVKKSFLMHEKEFDSRDWLKIDDKVENELDPDDGPESAVERAVLIEIFRELITNSTRLTPLMKQVLELRYLHAPSDSSKPTYKEIAGKTGVYIEKVRQSDKDALRRLKHPTIREKLKDFLDGDYELIRYEWLFSNH